MRVRLNRLSERYGWTGGKYRDLMTKIIARCHATVQENVSYLSEDHYRAQAKAMKKSTATQLAIPTAASMNLSRRQQIRKGATNGELLSDGMRTKLSQALRDTVKTYIDSGTHRRGEFRGVVDPGLVAEFRKKAAEVFADYTKTHGAEYPANIRAIAETEVRSAISDTKHEYATRLVEDNPGKIRMTKTWIHRPRLSNVPRAGHESLDGVTVGLNEAFSVPIYQFVRGKWYEIGRTAMQHPHDPLAPPEQVINCHCECNYGYEIIENRTAGSGVEKGYHKLAGRTEFQGLPISLEHRAGGIRQGVDPDGKPWKTKMLFPYGYIRGTSGVDGDEVDVFIGDDDEAKFAYVVHTMKPGSLDYDEDKVMLGFTSIVEARRWLEAHYDRAIIKDIEEIEMDALKRFIQENPGKKIEVEKAKAKVGDIHYWKKGPVKKTPTGWVPVDADGNETKHFPTEEEEAAAQADMEEEKGKPKAKTGKKSQEDTQKENKKMTAAAIGTLVDSYDGTEVGLDAKVTANGEIMVDGIYHSSDKKMVIYQSAHEVLDTLKEIANENGAKIVFANFIDGLENKEIDKFMKQEGFSSDPTGYVSFTPDVNAAQVDKKTKREFVRPRSVRIIESDGFKEVQIEGTIDDFSGSLIQAQKKYEGYAKKHMSETLEKFDIATKLFDDEFDNDRDTFYEGGGSVAPHEREMIGQCLAQKEYTQGKTSTIHMAQVGDVDALRTAVDDIYKLEGDEREIDYYAGRAEAQAEHLKNYIEENPLKVGLKLWRSMPMPKGLIEKGSIVSLDSFSSWTSDEETGANWTYNGADGVNEAQVVFAIEAPAGSKFAPPLLHFGKGEDPTLNSGEREFVGAPGLKVKMGEVKNKNGTMYIKAVLVEEADE